MNVHPTRILNWIDERMPPDTGGRKVAQILSIVLIVEGLSVLFLFSYVGLSVGLLSLLIGSLLLLMIRRPAPVSPPEIETPGVRFLGYLVNLVGGEYVTIIIGALVITAVIAYNKLFSSSPEIGDSDSLAIMFGLATMLYPLLQNRYKIEASFALIFIGIVMVLLVTPRFVMSLSEGAVSYPMSDSYVHYMLAAPFSGILDIIGIPSSSTGNMVTIEFRDGSIHSLIISAYCAGLYSFSIFLSAFISFVLVFENLRRRTLAIVLSLGLIVAYLGNLFRMVVIGIVGYYRGIDALHWTHENAGWIIFLSWSAVFWWLILGYISKKRPEPEDSSSEAC